MTSALGMFSALLRFKAHICSGVFKFYIFVNFWQYCVAYEIFIHQPGIEPVPPAVESQSLNHWTAREVPHSGVFCF